MKNTYLFAMTGLAVIALALLFPGENKAQIPPTQQLISENALLAGLAPGALFPFVDSTPRRIGQAHIAMTDAPPTARRVRQRRPTCRSSPALPADPW